jgi:hypothetical protein
VVNNFKLLLSKYLITEGLAKLKMISRDLLKGTVRSRDSEGLVGG